MQPNRHEFTAIIKGIELPSETVTSIDRAIQKAVIGEIASVDLVGSVALHIPPLLKDEARAVADGDEGDGPNGIWVNRLPPQS